MSKIANALAEIATLRAENARLKSELKDLSSVWGDLAESSAKVGVLLEDISKIREELDSAVSKIDNCDVDAVKLASRSDFYGITGTLKVPPHNKGEAERE